MIIDLHFHTKEFSKCSDIPLKEGIKKAKERGLDAICLTEHDVFANYSNLNQLEETYGIKIFVGTEILTTDGDILCFGLDKIPKNPISAKELVDYLSQIGGASIAAHPYRDNNRGIKDKILEIENLTAIEAYNGNTKKIDNEKTFQLCLKNKLRSTGSSDAHKIDEIGCYATYFSNNIETIGNLIEDLKNGQYEPVKYCRQEKSFVRID